MGLDAEALNKFTLTKACIWFDKGQKFGLHRSTGSAGSEGLGAAERIPSIPTDQNSRRQTR